MKNEVDSFLEGLDKNSESPFETNQEGSLKTEEKVEVKEEASDEEEKPLPFHKDPKVLKFIEKEVAKRVSGLTPAQSKEVAQATTTDEADEILTRIIGNDTPEKQSAIKDFKRYLASIEEKGAKRAMSEIEATRQAEIEAEEQAEEELRTGLENIEETYSVDLMSKKPAAIKARGEFLDFVKRISPKDENGDIVSYPDLGEAFALFQERTSKGNPTPSRAKELASRSMSRSGEAGTAPKADVNWNNVDRIFSKLGN